MHIILFLFLTDILQFHLLQKKNIDVPGLPCLPERPLNCSSMRLELDIPQPTTANHPIFNASRLGLISVPRPATLVANVTRDISPRFPPCKGNDCLWIQQEDS